MRRLFFVVLIGVAVCAAVMGFALRSGEQPTWSVLATLPERIRDVHAHGDDLLVAAGREGLLRVSTVTGEVTPLFDLKGLEIVDIELAAGVTHLLTYAAENRRNDLYLVDPNTGGFIRSITLGGGVTDLAGFLANGRLAVIQGVQVRFLDVEQGRTRTRDRVQITGGILGDADLAGERLYVARSYAGGLAVVDTTARELVELIEVEPWLMDVSVSGSLAYVVDKDGNVGRVDLNSRQYTALEYTDVLVAPDGTTYALTPEAVLELDDQGEVVDRTKVPADLTAALEGTRPSLFEVGADYAIITAGDRLLWLDPVWKKRRGQVAKAD